MKTICRIVLRRFRIGEKQVMNPLIVKCGSVKSYERHHLKEFYNKKLPLCICTDDKGVFSCSSSDEHFRAMQLLGLAKEEMYLQSVKCINYIFSGDTTKQVLRTQMQKIKNETLNE